MAKLSAERAQWGNTLQFTLTCIGFAVCLGNIWRFPSLAYQNGGGAFLVPYVVCSAIFGLPVLYLELCIGQFIQKGPSTAFGEFAPAFQDCISSTEDEACRRLGDGLAYFFNGTCHPSWVRDIVANKTELQARTMGATEQFFENLVLYRSKGIEDFGLFNWRTWKSALTQICFSLGIGYGGLLSLASHNEKSHNCFKEAIIVCVSDLLMSVIGGTAVFSILGFMAKHQGKELTKVVQEGTGLAFIAYPEAMGQLPAAWLWSFAYFIMLFLLGINNQFSLCEGVVTSLIDQFPGLENRRKLTVAAVCLCSCLVGVLMCTGSGIYWFTLFDDYTASFALCAAIFLEITCITTLYGIKRWRDDLRDMLGAPRRLVGKWLGPSGYIVCINWIFVSPPLILAVSVAIIKSMAVSGDTYGSGAFAYTFPYWSRVIGWVIGVSPSLMIPLFFCTNYTKNKRENLPFAKMFTVQKTHPSYERIENRRRSRTGRHYQENTKLSISRVFRHESGPGKNDPLQGVQMSVEVWNDLPTSYKMRNKCLSKV